VVIIADLEELLKALENRDSQSLVAHLQAMVSISIGNQLIVT